MKRGLIAALFILAFPLFTAAAAFGFPREPLWVSTTSTTAGDTVTMYAALYNGSGTPLEGTLEFLSDGTVFNTRHVSLERGGSSLVNDQWTAVEGSHVLSARFTSGTEKDATQKITVSVKAAPPKAPPPPSPVDKTISQAQSAVESVVTPNSTVGKITDAVLDKTEAVRTSTADAIRPYAAPTSQGKVLGASTFKGFTNAAMSNAPLTKKVTQMAATGALLAFDIKWVFYVLLIIVLYLVLRTLKRWVNRPRF